MNITGEAVAVRLIGVSLSENRKCGIEKNKCTQIISRGLLQKGVKEWGE